MSLTSRLRRRDDPLRLFFEERLPNLGGMHEAVRAAGKVTLLPSGPVPHGTVGSALDYRIRYYFSITPPEQSLAALGAAAFEASRGGRESARAAGGASHFDALAASLRELVSRAEPVGRRLCNKDETDLCRLCYLLALFEEWYRTADCSGSPLLGLRHDTDYEALMRIPDEFALKDLTRLSWAFFQTQGELFGEPGVLNPSFSGSKDVGGADADFIVGNTLIDVKATKSPRLRREHLYQLVGYALLDYDDVFGIDEVAFYLARRPALVRWRLGSLLEEMAGEVVGVRALRGDLQGVLREAAGRPPGSVRAR